MMLLAGRCVFIGLLAALAPAPVAGQDAVASYVLEMELWIDGGKRGEPLLIVETGEQAEVSSTASDGSSGWKIELEVESPSSVEFLPGEIIWIHLSVHQLVDGRWEHLTDSMLGVPEGERSALSVTGDDERAGADPENSLVYLSAIVSRLRPTRD